jgi:hypothetical protein
MKKTAFIFSILLVLLLSSCTKETSLTSPMTGPNGMYVSEINTNISKLITKSYSEEQLQEMEQSFYSLQDLNNKYPVKCLRKRGTIFRAVYKGKESILILYYDNSGKMLFSDYFVATLSLSDFGVLKKNDFVDSVRALDPGGQYNFLFTGRTDTPRISNHCTIDGYFIIIYYNAKWQITKIETELL